MDCVNLLDYPEQTEIEAWAGVSLSETDFCLRNEKFSDLSPSPVLGIYINGLANILEPLSYKACKQTLHLAQILSDVICLLALKYNKVY